MKNNFLFKFFLVLSGTTAFLVGAYVLLVSISKIPQLQYEVEIFAIQYVVSLLVFFLIHKALKFEPQYFVQIVILSMVVKLLLYGAFNFVIIYLSPDIALGHVLLFFIIYLVFTVLELVMLYPHINSKQGGPQQQKSEVN